MEDKKSPNKIKREKQIYWHEKNTQLRWKDIKHLEFEDDDLILSAWDEDEENYNSHWHCSITRMVEETDEQFAKRQADNERDAKWAKERRYESYLRLKKEFGEEEVPNG
jgi:hypothetical protein